MHPLSTLRNRRTVARIYGGALLASISLLAVAHRVSAPAGHAGGDAPRVFPSLAPEHGIITVVAAVASAGIMMHWRRAYILLAIVAAYLARGREPTLAWASLPLVPFYLYCMRRRDFAFPGDLGTDEATEAHRAKVANRRAWATLIYIGVSAVNAPVASWRSSAPRRRNRRTAGHRLTESACYPSR